MKIAIYSPYLDTLGGGEKYMMTIAEVLSTDNLVDVFLDKHLAEAGKEVLKEKLSQRFNLDLDKANFTEAPIGKESSLVARSLYLQKYDLFFCLTDGSIFYPTAGKNILHIQTPITGQSTKSLWGKFKLKGWDMIIYNSVFTQNHAKNYWKIKSEVVYPPVDVDKMKPLKKNKYILSVGRFFGYLKEKKHNVLINSFRQLFETGKIKEWSLHLVGSARDGDADYLEELKSLAAGVPIKFYPNLKYNDLVKLYGESSIYWHASGFEETDPTKMEHFGISTVEAMAGGCVPVVIAKGGQVEIVEKDISGYLWENPEELKVLTVKLIEDDNLRQKLAKSAIEKARKFSKENFAERITQVIKKI